MLGRNPCPSRGPRTSNGSGCSFRFPSAQSTLSVTATKFVSSPSGGSSNRGAVKKSLRSVVRKSARYVLWDRIAIAPLKNILTHQTTDCYIEMRPTGPSLPFVDLLNES